MRKFWLEKVVHLSSHVFKLKKRLTEVHTIKALFYIIAVVFFEIILAVFSFPLYLVQRQGSRGFHIRRVITLSSVGLILIIWVIKLLFTVGVNMYFESVSDESIKYLSTRGTKTEDVYLLNIETAEIDENLKIPKITGIRQKDKGIIFMGEGAPDKEIVLNVFGEISFAAIGHVKADNTFEIEYIDRNMSLPGGKYSVIASLYDSQTLKRSIFSDTTQFELNESFLHSFFAYLDIYLNLFVLFVIVFGLFLTVLVT